MSDLKGRLKRLEARAAELPRDYVAWIYYTRDEGSSVDFVSKDCIRLFVGRDVPHPFPGVHLYGIERGRPYPKAPSPNDRRPPLSAEIVGEVFDILDETLPPRMAAIVRRARAVLVLDNDPPPDPPKPLDQMTDEELDSHERSLSGGPEGEHP